MSVRGSTLPDVSLGPFPCRGPKILFMSERDRKTQDLTTKDTKEHGGEAIAEIAELPKNPNWEIWGGLP
jgi:hypothetical protein